MKAHHVAFLSLGDIRQKLNAAAVTIFGCMPSDSPASSLVSRSLSHQLVKFERNAIKKDDALSPRPQEIELKLALPACDPAELETKLARLPGLARRKPSHLQLQLQLQLQLHNTYYDTPKETLQNSPSGVLEASPV